MSNGSSGAAAWFTRLEPLARPSDLPCRADDPRLGEFVQFGLSDPAAIPPGRAVLVGFPQEEGMRRNQGRPGAAQAPAAIRHWLYRLTPWDAQSGIDLADHPPIDLGNLRIQGDLEQSQRDLGEVIAALLERGAVPVVLGGGHETAYGHYLGYATRRTPVGIINLDAHLDIRPCLDGRGHSGSPFRQALEYADFPLPGPHYVCLGVQPFAVARRHVEYARRLGCVVRFRDELALSLEEQFIKECERLAGLGCRVYVSIDADVVSAADVPAVSAPNAAGLAGAAVLACARRAGRAPAVASLDLVEVLPPLDRDGQSARWAAAALWHFLVGLGERTAG